MTYSVIYICSFFIDFRLNDLPIDESGVLKSVSINVLLSFLSSVLLIFVLHIFASLSADIFSIVYSVVYTIDELIHLSLSSDHLCLL